MSHGPVVVLTGGVGGAKLILGLTRVIKAERITAIVNTGDDFHHFGLSISPDIDTLLYTLSGKANKREGWGRAGESWSFMAAIKSLGAEDWFSLGDGDLASHVLRSHKLNQGKRLSEITRNFAIAWGLSSSILPMSDDPVTTILDTDRGLLEFQRYFVEHKCAPKIFSISYAGSTRARAADGVLDAISKAEAILIAPSNPYLSIDPILAIKPIADSIIKATVPVIAVSPLVGGQAIKGPTAKIMTELGVPITNTSIAMHYKGIIDGMVINSGDDIPRDIFVGETLTHMISLQDRERVAQAALALARQLIHS